MKNYSLIALYSLVAVFFSSCENELKDKLAFNAKVNPATANAIINDTIVVKKDSALSFLFEGNPQFISFFSGEAGNDYKYHNVTEIPAGDIDSCRLKFDVVPTGTAGTIGNTLSLYISDNYTGRIGAQTDSLKFSADSALIKQSTWTNLSALCAFPTTTATTKSVSLDMMSYLSKRIALQFKYQTTSNVEAQPKWEIKNLKYVLYPKGKAAIEYLAASLGFKQFDLLFPQRKAAYATSGAGVWSVGTPTNLNIASTAAGKPLNEDYLLSDPVKLNVQTPGTGVSVKSISAGITPYSCIYTAVGTYNATFVGSTGNFLDDGQQKTVSFIIKVIN